MGCRGGAGGIFGHRNERPDRVVKGATLATAADSQAPALDRPESDEPVSLLTINGESVTVEEVLKPIRDELDQRARTMTPGQYRSYLTEAIQYRVRLMARDRLVYQEAAKNLTDQEEEAVGRFVDQQVRERVNSEFAGRQTRYQKALAGQGLSMDDDRQRIRRELIIARWLRATVSPKIADPTRDELWTIFQNQKASMTKPERRKMQLIEISVLGQLPPDVSAPSAAQLENARTAAGGQAGRVRTEIDNGADFAEVAKQHSTGPQARNGGNWGWVTRGSVRRRWEPAVEALFGLAKCGVSSQVIETPDAFFIVQAASIDPGHEPDFESLQPELVEHFRNAQFNELVNERVERLQAAAHIRPRNISRFLRAVVQAAPQPTPDRGL